jgi:hypothetical protein
LKLSATYLSIAGPGLQHLQQRIDQEQPGASPSRRLPASLGLQRSDLVWIQVLCENLSTAPGTTALEAFRRPAF